MKTILLTPDPQLICKGTDLCEAMRYSGCRTDENEMLRALCKECISELVGKITPKAVCTTAEVTVEGDKIDFGFFSTESKSLRIFLGERRKVGIFAATLGVGADMLISRYSLINPSRAVMLDGSAGAMIECLCDKVTAEHFGAKPQERFSPGYGDLPLQLQSTLLNMLDANLKIGLTLSESLMLLPTKSVTAIVPIE